MDELNRKGGLSATSGIRYQTYYAIYRFLSADTTEIILEWLDEDLVIIDEDIAGPSMEFVQCKYITEEMFEKLDEQYKHIYAMLVTMERKAGSFCKV